MMLMAIMMAGLSPRARLYFLIVVVELSSLSGGRYKCMYF